MSNSNLKGYVVFLEGETRRNSDDLKIFFKPFDKPIEIDNETLKTLLNNYRDKMLPINIFRNIKRVETTIDDMDAIEMELIWVILYKTKDGKTGGILIHPGPEKTEALGYWERDDTEKITPQRLKELLNRFRDKNYWERIDLIIGNQ